MNFVKEPWPHQRVAIEAALKRWKSVRELGSPKDNENQIQSGYALFFEPRCGKTAVAINVLRYLCNAEKRKLKTLIFCPPIVVPNWKFEFGIHSKFEQDKIILLQGSGVKRLSTFEKEVGRGAHVFITNYESLLMADLFEALKAWNPEFLVSDESHRCKDSRAKRSKALEKLANPREQVGKLKLIRNAPYKMILTGSPILNNLMDLYQQFKILDGGGTFGYMHYQTKTWEPLSFQGFRQTYFTDKNQGMPSAKYFPDWVMKPEAMAHITELLKPVSMRVERKDVLVLPPTERVVIETLLSEKQKKLYCEMARDFITWYKAQPVVAKLALTKALRLLQITSGFVKTEEGQELYLDEIPKQEALKDLLTDILPSGKAIVWSVFKENYRQIISVCEALKVGYVEIHGGVSPAQKVLNVERFKTDPDVKVFIGHPESAGEGINLSLAPYNIFYSRTYSLKHFIQASARNQSQDSPHAKTVLYDIVAKGTIDQTVSEIIAAKGELAQEVYDKLILNVLLAN